MVKGLGLDSILQFISWRSFVDRINHKEGFLRQNNTSSDSELSDFSESSNDDDNIGVVYSQYTLYHIAIS